MVSVIIYHFMDDAVIFSWCSINLHGVDVPVGPVGVPGARPGCGRRAPRPGAAPRWRSSMGFPGSENGKHIYTPQTYDINMQCNNRILIM